MDSLLDHFKLKSIKHQLRAIFAMLVVLPIIIIGVYAFVVSKSNVTELTRASMMGSAEVISYGVDMSVKRETDVIKFFSHEENFRRALEHADSDPYTLSEEMTNTIEPLIWYYIGNDSNIEEIHIYSDRLSKERIGDFLSAPQDDEIKEWYEKCKTENDSIWVINAEGEVYIIKSLLDAATTSKMIGMATLKINKDEFFSATTSSGYLDNGLAIVDSSNMIVAKKDLNSDILDEKVKEDILEGKYTDLNGFKSTDDYLIIKSNDMNNGWQLYYYVDSREMLADEITILLGDLIIAITILALGFLIASQMANRFCTRIERLNIIAEDIKRGDFEVAIVDDGKDEIGRLYNSMVDMASQLKTMVDEIKRRNERELILKENDIHYRDWLFDFVVEKNNDILAIVNAKSFAVEFLTANTTEILGIPAKEMIKDIRNIDIAQKAGEERLSTVFERCAQTGKIEVVEEIKLQNLSTGTDLYYRGAVVCTIDDSGRRLAIALYDRTQEIKRNHQLQEAFNAAEAANKAKTNFLANMSHDFRTPMNAITGFNLLIEKHSEEPDKVREYTRKISLASRSLLSLLNEVLDMSKIESGRTTLAIKEMAIGILLEEINSVIAYQAKAKNQEYIVRAERLEHDVFMGDKQRISEILLNILSNAIKYTKEGGRIEFTITESKSASEGFSDLTFAVKDNGIGMKPEYKEKIFEAFSREERLANKEIQGTGLGMAITKSLVELMGGIIRVDTEEGKGSTFTVILRLQAVDAADVDFWKKHGIRRILFINSDHKECEQLSEKLNIDGVDVMESPTGFGGMHLIDVCRAEDKPVDLILIDQKVQTMTAPEIVRNIRAKDKSLTTLIIVMADEFEVMEEPVKEAGANDLLQKPLFISSLKQSVEDIAKRVTESSHEAEENPLKGMKFLAAEDNDINADILIELMEMEGATVTRCVNGQDVVEKFKESEEGDFDMILMDIQMPVMNGYEAAILIRSLKTKWAQEIPILAMTANAYADDIQKTYDAGMNAHISKPIDIRVVEKTIMEFKKT
ncbi:MAG: response regulator [Butyrivibrio sp.]|nr:response regulator [Butyrivibrio sp.]